ncbi:RHS repeat-associated core domain-containing protein [Pseudomonas sp. DCB_AW]|jgi:RHS repeat-associated protein|uniref:RHS repeat-associated core domain-containing protein n=1 Tax=Pseudomonas sp. DCB_AW TaxID=2993596 RepID=UPI002248D970|nr:RHS repeat-associated core domain-containing protein [Pseudomonas sp. DCB_AW]MCX2688711.1 RHS repeat-associated core domain-containing protein [Pseudomonas sp. DCB_AW]
MNRAQLLMTDMQRSALMGSGASSKMRAYTPYGYALLGAGPFTAFAGERHDSTSGCYLLGNGYRSYSPGLLRFLSPDTLSPFDLGGFNAYAYCAGDPVNRSDPSGRGPLDWVVQAIFGVGNATTIAAAVSFSASRHAIPPAQAVTRLQAFTDRAIANALTLGGSAGLAARYFTARAMMDPSRAAMFNQQATTANLVSGVLVGSATVVYEGRAAIRWVNQSRAAGRRPGQALARGVYESTNADLIVGAARSVARGIASVASAVGDAARAVYRKFKWWNAGEKNIEVRDGRFTQHNEL